MGQDAVSDIARDAADIMSTATTGTIVDAGR
jgi:hypothetical protein